MESIRKKEDELFKRWKEHLINEEITFFVQDGTLDPESFTKSNVKICSILKEVPDDKSGFYIFDISKRIEMGNGKFFLKKMDTLRNISRWTTLIKEILFNDNFSIKESSFFPHPLLQKQHVEDLFSSAYINIKKYNGKIFSIKSDLDRIAKKDKEFLLEQIDNILEPHIVITAGTFGQYRLLFKETFTLIVNIHPIKIWCHETKNGTRLVFDLYHPLFKNMSHKLYFYNLQIALEELKSTSFINKFKNEIIC
jgi:hypothetical protein